MRAARGSRRGATSRPRAPEVATLAALVVLGFATAALLLGWVVFRRYELARPPIGVISLGDVAFMLAAVVVVPILYLTLPRWLVGGLLTLACLSALVTLAQAVLRRGWLAWAAALALLAADVASALLLGAAHPLFFAVNNTALVLLVVGVSTLWAQSGLRARDAAVLGGGLAAYDLVATSLLPLTDDLIARLAGLPLAPVVAWSVGDGRWLGLGLGDLLMVTVFPLVMRRAYGRPAGRVSILAGLSTITVLLGLGPLGLLPGTFPVMVLLGPLAVAQYGFWHRRLGPERTTWQYLRAEPVSANRRTREPGQAAVSPSGAPADVDDGRRWRSPCVPTPAGAGPGRHTPDHSRASAQDWSGLSRGLGFPFPTSARARRSVTRPGDAVADRRGWLGGAGQATRTSAVGSRVARQRSGGLRVEEAAP
jgi:hypothetical protein